MTRARLALLGGALVAAAASLAYVRSTDADTKACLYWGPRTVYYRLNYGRTIASSPTASPTCSQEAETTAITTGFDQWTGRVQACTDLNLVFDGTSASPIGFDRASGAANENTVGFRSGWCSIVAPGCVDVANTPLSETCANRNDCFEDSAENGRDTLALTTTTYNQRTGEILDADMELNGWDGQGTGTGIDPSFPADGWYFTCQTPTSRCTTYGQPDCIWIDVQNTVTHEAGHFIGLAHPCGGSTTCAGVDSTTTMYPYSGAGDVAKRSLEQDDIGGLCAIYPRGKAAVTCVPPSKSGGCASGGGAGITALLLGVAALRPRLRRRRA